MYTHRASLFRKGVLAFDVGISLLSFLLTFFCRQWIASLGRNSARLPEWLQVPLITEPDPYFFLLVSMPALWGIGLYISGTNDFRVPLRRTAWRYARAVALGSALFITASFLFKLHAVARSFVVLFGAVNLLALVLGRYILMEAVAFFRKKRVDGHRVVVVGCDDRAVGCAESLRNQPPWNIKILGHIKLPNETPVSQVGEPMGTLAELDRILDTVPIDEVLFCGTDNSDELLPFAINACDERGVDVLLPLPPAVPAQTHVEIATIQGFDSPLLGIRKTPTDEFKLALKRAIDLVAVSLILIPALPVMIVVALAVKLSSRGPVLFRQIRSGRHGRTFTMLKFRSMEVDAEAKKDELMHMNEMSGPVFKIAKDPRVTRVGSLIRKTSLDELPQLLNILLGDMSLVGPRPPLPSEVAEYKPWQRRRLSVKPGLTGLWQVSGRNNIDFEEWMRMDLRYIDDWSLWLDIKIIFKTVPAVLFKIGAS